MPTIPHASSRPASPGTANQTGQGRSDGGLRNAFEGIASSAFGLVGPYYSPKRDRDVALNGEARVGNAPLFCGVLSTLWERSFNEREGKPDYRHFSSIEGIEGYTPRDFAEVTTNRRQAHAAFVDNAAWGRRIADHFLAMDATGRTHRTLQVQAPDHAMVLGLRIKSRHGTPAYVVKFYDPNRTATHQRTMAANPDAFARLEARDFLEGPERLADYRMDEDDGSVVFLGDPARDHALQPVSIEHTDPSTMLHLLRLGLAAGVARFGELVQARTLEPSRIAELLSVKSEEGIPGLFMAMHHGDGAAIRAYGDILLRGNFGARESIDLLECRTDGGIPGLYIAMQDNRADAIQAWGDVLLRCKLDASDVVDLLACRRHDGVSGLYMAMYWNRAAAIRAYGRILLACGLPATTCVELLEAADGDGTPAMAAARRHGSDLAIQAFEDIVAASGLAPSQRRRLLDADALR